MKTLKYSALFFILIIAIIFLVSIGCQLIYVFRLAGSRLITTPSTNIEQTAEYLYYNPLPLPSEINDINGDINLPTNYLCAVGDFAKNNLPFQTISWIINGSRIPDWMYKNSFYTIDSYDSCLNDAFYRWLYPGFHLIEIYWQSNPFDPGKSYQFGVRVNDVLPTPLPTLIPQIP